MHKNVGSADRVIRILLALAIGAVIFAKIVSGVLAIVLGIFAVVFLITGLIGWCGLYALLGINTGANGSCCGTGNDTGCGCGCDK